MFSSVNSKRILIKAHFFLFFAGLSTVAPYIPLIAQDLGISASAFGIIATFISLFGVMAKPLFGSIADHFQKLKPLLIAVSVGSTLAYLALDLLPQGHLPFTYLDVPISFLSTIDETSTFRLDASASCIKALNARNTSRVEVECTVETMFANGTGMTLILEIFPVAFDDGNQSLTDPNTTWFSAARNAGDGGDLHDCRLIRPAKRFDRCPVIAAVDSFAIYRTYQFWLFLVFAIVSRAGTYVVVSLSDTACFEILGDNVDDYGKQRLWGSAGWGTFCLVGGALIKAYTHPNGDDNYSPGFYMMVAMYLLDIVVLYFMKLKSPPVAQNIWSNVGRLVRNLEVFAFLVAVFAVGVLTGFQWNYFYMYLKSLGATSLLLGIALAIQCFLGEMPFFFITGWVIRKIGYMNALTITFLSFAVRSLCYSYTTNPWFVLPVELLEGTSFGLFYSVITSYAKVISTEGTEATTQGLICGVFDGLGLALGGLLGGFAIDQLGGALAYRSLGYLAFAFTLIHIAVHTLYKLYNQSQGQTKSPSVANNIGSVNQARA